MTSVNLRRKHCINVFSPSESLLVLSSNNHISHDQTMVGYQLTIFRFVYSKSNGNGKENEGIY